MVNAVDIPTRQALVGDLVDQPEDLGNALALNAALTNGARLIGPALAGVVIVRLGEGCLSCGRWSGPTLPPVGSGRTPRDGRRRGH